MRRSAVLLMTVVLTAARAVSADAGDPASAAASSVYSDIGEQKCKTVKVDQESGYSKQTCAGTHGYSLVVEEQDGRVSITVVTPDQQQHPIDPGEAIGSGFTTLGPRAEWRMGRVNGQSVPTALIYRINEQATAAPGDELTPHHMISRLVVARLTGARICATAVIEAGKDQNGQARTAAAKAGKASCLK